VNFSFFYYIISYIFNLIGLCVDMGSHGAFLFTAFDSMFSPKFCGSKAADFCGSVSNSVFVLLTAKDVTETLNGYDQIFRRIIKKVISASSPVQSITFLVKYESVSSEDISKEIKDRLAEIWSDMSGDDQVYI
jgi:hypothetical protein